MNERTHRMSRPAKRSGEFNKELFAELLKRAKGEKKQAEFADSVPMSRTYLSSLINAQNERPLMPGMLEKIADASEGRVSYEELLSASGYNPNDYLNKKNEKTHVANYLFGEEARIDATIMGNLRRSSFKWINCVTPGSIENGYDLSIMPDGSDLEYWHFDYKCFKRLERVHATQARLLCYGRIAEQKGLEKSKLSIVTNSPVFYNNLVTNKPMNLNVYLSVVLIDINTVSVKAEEVLCRPSYIQENCPVRFNIEGNII